MLEKFTLDTFDNIYADTFDGDIKTFVGQWIDLKQC